MNDDRGRLTPGPENSPSALKLAGNSLLVAIFPAMVSSLTVGTMLVGGFGEDPFSWLLLIRPAVREQLMLAAPMYAAVMISL